MKIAIVGAGFSGLACAWHLLYMPQETPQVTLFDQTGIGGGASGIAAGLMHPFVGAKATLNWRAREAVDETLKLLHAAQTSLGKPVASYHGMLRPALTEEIREAFSRTEASESDVEWWTGDKVQNHIPELLPIDSLFISSSITVDSQRYLQGLWKACTEKGATLEIAQISNDRELDGFDHVIFAVGANWKTIPHVKVPALSFLKGQILELAWPKDREPLPCAVNAGMYLATSQDHRFFAGATFERSWKTEGPDLATSEDYIRTNLALFSPSFAALPLIECRAQIRAMTKDKLPFICRSGVNQWSIGGMGSKGLLYHALMAKELCNTIIYNESDKQDRFCALSVKSSLRTTN